MISIYISRAEPERAFLPRGSEWLRTKYAGELAVRDQFPDATIFRCSGIFYIYSLSKHSLEETVVTLLGSQRYS